MTGEDDKGPMQGPRTTRDVLKAAPPAPPAEDCEPEAGPTDSATHGVDTDQEDA